MRKVQSKESRVIKQREIEEVTLKKASRTGAAGGAESVRGAKARNQRLLLLEGTKVGSWALRVYYYPPSISKNTKSYGLK